MNKFPADALVLFVPKKDSGLRLYPNYRALNAITVKNRYLLSLVSELLDQVQGIKIYTKLNIRKAYHCIQIKPRYEWKTAFCTGYGHYKYVVLLFELANAPATFQSYINNAFKGLVDIICLTYLDDIFIFSRTLEVHSKHMKIVLEHLCK